MVTLFIMEIMTFLQVKHVTNIIVDTSEDGLFRVNFNITFPRLSCEYLRWVFSKPGPRSSLCLLCVPERSEILACWRE